MLLFFMKRSVTRESDIPFVVVRERLLENAGFGENFFDAAYDAGFAGHRQPGYSDTRPWRHGLVFQKLLQHRVAAFPEPRFDAQKMDDGRVVSVSVDLPVEFPGDVAAGRLHEKFGHEIIGEFEPPDVVVECHIQNVLVVERQALGKPGQYPSESFVDTVLSPIFQIEQEHSGIEVTVLRFYFQTVIGQSGTRVVFLVGDGSQRKLPPPSGF